MGLLSNIGSGIKKVGSAIGAVAKPVLRATLPALIGYGASVKPKPTPAPLTAPQQTLSNNLTTGGGLLGQAVGFKATSPDANIKPPTQTLPQSQTAPNTLLTAQNSVFNQPKTGGSVGTGGGTSTAGGSGGSTITSSAGPVNTAKLPGESDAAYGARMQTQYAAADATRAGAGAGGVAGAAGVGGVAGAGGSAGAAGAGYQSQQPGGLYGALIAAQAGSALGVNPMTQQGMSGYQQAQQQIADLNRQYAQQQGGIESTPMELEYQQGQKQILGRQYASELSALQSAAQQQQAAIGFGQAQQGLMQSGLSSAAGLAQPVSQFGMLTNPITGVPLNTQVFMGAVQQAQQLVNNGVPANDPSVQQLLQPFGFVGPMAFNQAMSAQQGGGWNPASQSAAAGQNLAFQGQTQATSQQLGLGLAQLDAFQPKITNFMQASGINPSNVPVWNEQIKTYLDRIQNPGLSQQWNAMTTDIQSIAQSIITAKNAGGTPTSTTEMAALNNPGSLSMSALKSVMDTWKNLGNTTLGVYQGQYGQAGGAGNAYLGGAAQQGGNITPSSGGAGFTNPNLQGVGGAFYNILSSPAALMSFISSIF